MKCQKQCNRACYHPDTTAMIDKRRRRTSHDHDCQTICESDQPKPKQRKYTIEPSQDASLELRKGWIQDWPRQKLLKTQPWILDDLVRKLFFGYPELNLAGDVNEFESIMQIERKGTEEMLRGELSSAKRRKQALGQYSINQDSKTSRDVDKYLSYPHHLEEGEQPMKQLLNDIHKGEGHLPLKAWNGLSSTMEIFTPPHYLSKGIAMAS